MPGLDGTDLLRAVQRQLPQLPVLLMTAYASISKSVEAMRCGAVDYLVKPFRPQQLVDCIARYTGAAHQDGAEPVAEAAASRRLFALARRVAATDSTVLIMGESGTGKEVLARHVHQHSPRAKGPFVAINCAAIPDTMLEAILFGHERGAFTGAHSIQAGHVDVGDDQVDRLPLQQLEGCAAILGGQHGIAGQLQGVRQRLAQLAVVLHHQQPCRHECLSRSGRHRGRDSRARAPPPTASASSNCPRWLWATLRTTARPSPQPWARVVWKGSSSRRAQAPCRPGPLSPTSR